MCVSRCGAIFSGVFCLLQGLVWLGLCIVGLLAFKCNFQVDYKEVEVFLDIYFNHGQCEGATHSELADILKNIIYPHTYIDSVSSTPIPYPSWPNVVPASERTQILLILYVVWTSCWIFTSMLLTIGASIESKGPSAAIFYVPWIVITSIICVTDVISTILYGLDISKTTNLLDFLKFIGFNNITDLGKSEELTKPQIYTAVPAIVMTAVSARGILLWLFNLILLLTTLLALKNNLENYRIMKKKQKEGEWRNLTKLWLTEPAPRKNSSESIPPDRAEPNPWQMRPKNLSPPTRMYDNNIDSNRNEMDNTFHNFLRAEDEGRSSFRDNGPPPAELRNGLPWSYFSHRDDLKGPPKRNKNVLEPMPPVPPPDYTLKFPQYTRPVMKRNGDYRSSWSSKDGSVTATPELPFIPAPDYERKRLPPRLLGRQVSQESNNSQAPPARSGNRQLPYIPQPDYDNRQAPPNVMKPNMKQELQAMVAARGRANLGYVSTEDDGYRQPHIQAAGYAKPLKTKPRIENLRNRPNDDFLMDSTPYNISGPLSPNKVTGRSRHYGYF